MTLQEFSDIFALLAVQLRFTDADEATIRAYHKALEDLEPEFAAMAAQRYMGRVNAQGEAWFPKAPEWRVLTATIEMERWEAVRAHLRKLPSPACLVCADTWWAALPGEPVRYDVCECKRLLRWPEVLGRRPMPMLPEGSVGGTPVNLERIGQALASQKGLR